MTVVRRGLIISALVLVVLLGVAFAAAFLIDEPLRRYVETQMNQRLEGYTVRIGRLDFHPIGLSVDFENLIVTQDAHPDPPVANIERITASVHWRALIRGRVVADFAFDRPILYVNLAHVRREATDERPVTERGWQDALEAMYPLKINQFRVRHGEVTYEDQGPFKPLKLTAINAIVTNVRNVRSRDRVYPSDIRLDLTVFDSGRLSLDGHADFMAVPHPGVRAVVELEQIELDYLRPILAHYNVDLRKGTLSAQADLEYSPKLKAAHLHQAVLHGVEGDYIQRAKGAAPVKRAAAKTAREAQAVNNAPGIEIKVDKLQVVKAKVGFVNQATRVPYRVFLSDANLDLANLSNHSSAGTATARLQGKFMGTGTALVTGHFRPEVSGPDFDLDVRIENVELTSMNDLLRAYGQFDVVDGLFSLYAELAVKNQTITGYMKPLFRNLDVYDPDQDEHKGLVKKTYERVVGGVGKLLQNRPRDEVATKTEVRGRVDNPKASTIEVLGNLIQNAFFKAILPGFENELRPRRK
jgi:Domain of Unknown Function (DUF748)